MSAFEDATNLSSARFLYALPFLWRFKKFFKFGSERVLKDSISIVHQFANNIIKSTIESGGKQEDLLSRFIRNEENSPEFLRDIAISFILAGRDTTSTALTWFFWLLSSHPEIEKKILNELEKIRAQSGKVIGDTYSFDEIRDMYYLQAAITESMRLYPPVSIDTKGCMRDDILPDGSFIGKGWFLSYSAYCMGRMESVWGKDCLEYRPERWLDENGMCRQESPFKYPVFHAGPRICLGKDMAYIQMKSIAASVIERFVIDVENKNKTPPEHVLSLTLRMKGGLQVKVKERKV
jgi:cytochrome P450